MPGSFDDRMLHHDRQGELCGPARANAGFPSTVHAHPHSGFLIRLPWTPLKPGFCLRIQFFQVGFLLRNREWIEVFPIQISHATERPPWKIMSGCQASGQLVPEGR